MNIEILRAKIFSESENRKRGKIFRDMARELESSMLLEETFPECIFHLYKDIFSTPALLSAKGTDWFMFHIYNDFEKLSKKQLELLKRIIVQYSNYVNNEDLKLVIIDILYRKMSREDLLDMYKISQELNLVHANNDIFLYIKEKVENYLI